VQALWRVRARSRSGPVRSQRTAISALPGALRQWTSPAPEALLPHRPPALFLRAVAEVAAGGVVAVAEISPSPPPGGGRPVPRLSHPGGPQPRLRRALEALCRSEGGGTPDRLPRRDSRRPALTCADAGRWTPLFASRPGCKGGASPLAVYAVTIGEERQEVAAGTVSTFLVANS